MVVGELTNPANKDLVKSNENNNIVNGTNSARLLLSESRLRRSARSVAEDIVPLRF
jgi:hypothetical protein